MTTFLRRSQLRILLETYLGKIVVKQRIKEGKIRIFILRASKIWILYVWMMKILRELTKIKV